MLFLQFLFYSICRIEGQTQLCPRAVSSIICVHDPDECQPGKLCDDGSVCAMGKCKRNENMPDTGLNEHDKSLEIKVYKLIKEVLQYFWN